MQALRRHDARAERQALGAVVVPGGHDHRDFQAQQQLRQHIVEEPDRLGRRDRPVVDIPRHDDRVHPGVARHLDELAQHVVLVLRQVDLVEQTPEVPVGGVQEAHTAGTILR